ncbi:Na/Pi symporter [Cecembia rubra]|uniref:Sodium-dependent phosphate cotransporter n=1 Tax=Cecembia rubra TaxID=1485585 RepID=A0A2P8E1X4_9BACT|nr:Na/Pi symporter [Cecembia rubra]PSL03481.1 sodium-dependent phosphate cotransporter [Cecembia rubra]
MSSSKTGPKGPNRLFSVLITVLGLLLFMLSIDLLTVSMIRLNSDFASSLFRATNNPFIGLFVGLLMTALIQSSSTVTAMIVAVVASGSLTLGQAVPLVMGANIGTTITSTLVAFSFIMKRNVFKKALAAGVLHDIFNILTVLILFPLEVYFGFLSETASFITATFFDSGGEYDGNYQYNVLFTRPLTLWIANLIGQPFLLLLFAVIMVFTSIKLLSKFVLKSFMSANVNKINKHIFQKPFFSFLYGAFFTAAVQSSTVTTSIIVPAVANRKVSLVKAFPFIIGANIGTTITAAIAAIYKTDAAISLAVVHFLFNMIGAMLFMPFPSIRNIPVKIATYLGNESTRTRLVGFAYILLTFFIIPFLLIYFNKNEDIREMGHADRYQKTEIKK